MFYASDKSKHFGRWVGDDVGRSPQITISGAPPARTGSGFECQLPQPEISDDLRDCGRDKADGATRVPSGHACDLRKGDRPLGPMRLEMRLEGAKGSSASV